MQLAIGHIDADKDQKDGTQRYQGEDRCKLLSHSTTNSSLNCKISWSSSTRLSIY